jgi:hypothetical protein
MHKCLRDKGKKMNKILKGLLNPKLAVEVIYIKIISKIRTLREERFAKKDVFFIRNTKALKNA